jgi:hypothetical protein
MTYSVLLSAMSGVCKVLSVAMIEGFFYKKKKSI